MQQLLALGRLATIFLGAAADLRLEQRKVLQDLQQVRAPPVVVGPSKTPHYTGMHFRGTGLHAYMCNAEVRQCRSPAHTFCQVTYALVPIAASPLACTASSCIASLPKATQLYAWLHKLHVSSPGFSQGTMLVLF